MSSTTGERSARTSGSAAASHLAGSAALRLLRPALLGFAAPDGCRCGRLGFLFGRLSARRRRPARDLVADELLDPADRFGILSGRQRDRDARHARAAGAADAMDVIVGLPRHVEIDDVADAFDVETAGRDVGGDEDRDLVILEAIELGDAIGLVHVALDLADREAGALQAAGELANRRLAVGEDDRVLEFLVAQDVAQARPSSCRRGLRPAAARC